MPNTTDDLFAAIAEAGFLVNNLFQCNTRQWQANLRSPAGFTEFGLGRTPAEALDECLHRISALIPDQPRPAPSFTIEQRQSLRTLLGIGATTTAPIRRRA